MSARVSVCFVCLGNICRSPTAEGVMRALLQAEGLQGVVEVDSAGTGAYHAGERADARARAVAEGRGLRLTSIARQFVAADFARFDYVVAMDRQNLRNLRALTAEPSELDRLLLLRSLDAETPGEALDVPDPYYEDNFDEVFDICDRGCRGLLARMRSAHGL